MVREDLMGRIADLGDLKRAWERVKSNKGSGGIDGETVGAFGERAWTHLREMQSELLEGRYWPVPVRGVEIPKPNGGKRQLGIPTVKDRIVQQAVAQAIMPRYERVFSDSSYGFRPNRRAHDALRRGSAYVAEGYSTVVDLDLSKFFDRVNHDRLMAGLARDIGDGRVLRLVLAFLKAGLMQNGVCRKREEGTPQGGPLSPLLANVVLDELDDFPDSHFDNAILTIAQEDEKFKVGECPHWYAAWSNEAFELWYLLHFRDALGGPKSRFELCEMLSEHFKADLGIPDGYHKNDPMIFDLLYARMDHALIRAERAFARWDPATPPHLCNPASRVFELVKFLRLYS